MQHGRHQHGPQSFALDEQPEPAQERRTVDLHELGEMLQVAEGSVELQELWRGLRKNQDGRALLPDDWRWVLTGEGLPPGEYTLPPSATSLLDIYIDLPEAKQQALLNIAREL